MQHFVCMKWERRIFKRNTHPFSLPWVTMMSLKSFGELCGYIACIEVPLISSIFLYFSFPKTWRKWAWSMYLLDWKKRDKWKSVFVVYIVVIYLNFVSFNSGSKEELELIANFSWSNPRYLFCQIFPLLDIQIPGK